MRAQYSTLYSQTTKSPSSPLFFGAGICPVVEFEVE
jgi:hypothetical protein